MGITLQCSALDQRVCELTVSSFFILKTVKSRGERIVFWWPNTNTNIIRLPKNDRIRIRILFGFPKMTEYEYEYYSAFQKGPNTNIIQFSKNDRIRILFGFPKIHSGEKSNKCKQCEYAVLHAYHSSEHLNTHRKEHFHKCEQCDLAFLIQEILGRICKRTDKCNHCKYAQYQTGNLRTQMKMHSGEKLNQCNQCDYVYSDPSTLRTHLKRREKSN